jgi:hypothetical protein
MLFLYLFIFERSNFYNRYSKLIFNFRLTPINLSPDSGQSIMYSLLQTAKNEPSQRNVKINKHIY